MVCSMVRTKTFLRSRVCFACSRARSRRISSGEPIASMASSAEGAGIASGSAPHAATAALSTCAAAGSPATAFSSSSAAPPSGALNLGTCSSHSSEAVDVACAVWCDATTRDAQVSRQDARARAMRRRGRGRAHLELQAPKELAVGLTLVGPGGRGGARIDCVLVDEQVVSSGAFRRGFTFAETAELAAGVYTLVPSTFEPGQCGAFVLTVCTSAPLRAARPIG